jgi:hypothetical protein
MLIVPIFEPAPVTIGLEGAAAAGEEAGGEDAAPEGAAALV